MELQRPEVREQFHNYVLSLCPVAHQEELRIFLQTFLDRILVAEAHQLHKPFSISLTEAAEWLGTTKGALRRKIEQRHASVYCEAQDYIYDNRQIHTRKETEILLTVDAFTRLCLSYGNAMGDRTRRYFAIIERAHRDYMGEALAARLSRENPAITRLKERNTQPLDIPPGLIGRYAIQIQNEGKEIERLGISENFNHRFQRHHATTAGLVSPGTFKEDLQPDFYNFCMQRYAAAAAVPCREGGSCDRSYYYKNSPIYQDAKTYCENAISALDAGWRAKMKAHGETPAPVPLPSRVSYPKRQLNPRRNKHSWLDGPIARYDTNGFNPVLITPVRYAYE